MEQNKLINVESLKVQVKENLEEFKAQQETVVKENPFMVITDHKSYEEAKKRRTALVKARTGFNAQIGIIKDALNGLKNDAVTYIEDELISITKPYEDEQQAEVKRYEAEREKIKQEKAEKERKRVQDIQDKLNEIKTFCVSKINTMIYANRLNLESEILEYLGAIEFDFEEFIIEFEELTSTIETMLKNKVQSLESNEKLRLENLKNKRMAKIDNLYRQASEVINKMDDYESISDAKSALNNVLEHNFDFGDINEKWLETEQMIIKQFQKAEENYEKNREQKLKIERLEKENDQRKSLQAYEVRLVKHIDGLQVDTFSAGSINFNLVENNDVKDFDLLPDEFAQMVDRVKEHQEKRLVALKEEKKSADAVAEKIRANRKEQLEKLGFVEKDGNMIHADYKHDIPVGALSDYLQEGWAQFIQDFETEQQAKLDNQFFKLDHKIIKQQLDIFVQFETPGTIHLEHDESFALYREFYTKLESLVEEYEDKLNLE